MVGFEENTRNCRRGDSTCVVHWCSPLSFLCWKQLCSVCCVLFFIADVRRGCCTAVFEKRMEAVIIRSFPEGASGLLCHTQTFVLVRVVLRCNSQQSHFRAQCLNG